MAPLAHAAKEHDDDQAAWLAALPYTTTLPGASAAGASLYQPQAFPFIHDTASALPTPKLLRSLEDTVLEALGGAGIDAEGAVRQVPLRDRSMVRQQILALPDNRSSLAGSSGGASPIPPLTRFHLRGTDK